MWGKQSDSSVLDIGKNKGKNLGLVQPQPQKMATLITNQTQTNHTVFCLHDPSLLPSGVQHFISQGSKRNSNSSEFDSGNPVILHLLPSSEGKNRIHGNVK